MTDPTPTSDIAALIELAQKWGNFERSRRASASVGEPPLVGSLEWLVDRCATAFAAQQAEIERLLAPKMWCLSCGAITRDGGCDCTRSHPEAQKLVNYEEELRRQAVAAESALAARDETIRRLRAATGFLLDRLDEHEVGDVEARDWFGHVVPAKERARTTLNSTEPSDA